MMAFPLSEHAGQLRRAHRSPANARQRLFHVSGGRARTQSIARPPSQASPRPETPPREGLTHRHAQAGVPAGAHEAEARLLLRPLGTLPRAQHDAAAAAALPPHHRNATPQRDGGRGRTRSNLIHTQVGTAHQHRGEDIRNPTHNNEATNEHCARTPPRGKVAHRDRHGRQPAHRHSHPNPTRRWARRTKFGWKTHAPPPTTMKQRTNTVHAHLHAGSSHTRTDTRRQRAHKHSHPNHTRRWT